MSLKKKIIITIALGILIVLGIFSFIEHFKYVIQNFSYDIEDPTFGGIYYNEYYSALISHIIRLIYIGLSSIILTVIVLFSWKKIK
jgi:hypothetical protein